MKKTYMKPGLYVENFALSQEIAGNCGHANKPTLGVPAHDNKDSCGWDMGNLIVWTVGVTPNCTFPGGDKFEGICYNNPNGGQTIFAS